MLERKALAAFNEWQARSANHGLLVTGARQVGKTFLVQEFARANYKRVAYFDLVSSEDALRSFSQATSADDLAFRIGVMSDTELVPGESVIIIDEVQECPEIITYAKRLVSRGDFDYIFTGSLLGVKLKNIRSFPVGYVTEVHMYPLDFQEFAAACGLPHNVWDVVAECIESGTPIPEHVHERLLQLYRKYLLIGGMPDAVQAYLESDNIDAVRTAQRNIRTQYGNDISKYAPEERRLMIRSIYDLIPSQLSQQNRRFQLSAINDVKRFTQVKEDFLWLDEAGVALPAYNVSKPAYPLQLNDKRTLLKLFSSDIGLLTGSFLKRDVADILDGRLSDSRGGVYENFVAQELSAHGYPLRYFTKKGIGELDIVTERVDGAILAFEVKSGRGYKTHAAIDNALSASDCHIDEAYVLAECNVEHDGQIPYLPIYAIALFENR